MLGLVLTAGGARGAYQAGVLKLIGEMQARRGRASPFAIIAGASAGAINGAMLAARSADFHDATQELARLWAELQVSDVFRTDALRLTVGALRWVRDLTLGSLLGGAGTQSLLDASPLRGLLARSLPLDGIERSIRDGHLYAVALSATSYHSGRSFTFVQGRDGHPVWAKSRRVVVPIALTLDHVCASAAIPIVFSPVAIRSTGGGECWFGDGGLRLVNPLSPAIRLGATRVFAIGIRSQQSAAALARAELPPGESGYGDRAIVQPPLAQICGVFLNAIFLDHLDADLDHLRRMNELIAAHADDGGARPQAPRGPISEPMRTVAPFAIGPSEDLALVAETFAHKMPLLVRHLIAGLGTPDAQSADLTSYLLFDSAYTRALLDIGYCDAAARRDEIEEFLYRKAATRAA